MTLNLMPPKRQVWIAVWLTSHDKVACHAYDSEEVAEEMLRCGRRIAVLGPVDVEGAK